MNCHIQQLTKIDWQRGREIRLRSLADTPNAFGATLEVEEQLPDEKWVERVSREDVATFVVVSQDGQDVGLVTMAPYKDDIGLYGMWVDPNFRKQAVGGMLVDAGVNWARELGFHRIFLNVDDDNHGAIALYKSRRFLATGERGALPEPREYILEHQRSLELNKMVVESLYENRHLIPIVAQWLFDEWGRHIKGRSIETSIASLSASLDDEGLPHTLIGKIDDEVVAVSRLVHEDLQSRCDLTPWLASVYVHPNYRSKGYGSQICNAIMELAKSSGLKELYLYTPDRRGFYENLSWKFMQTELDQGKEVALMKVSLA